MKLSTQRSGLLLILLTAAGYSFFPIWTKILYENGVTALDMVIWRFFLAAPLMWGAVAVVGRAKGQPQETKLLPRYQLIGMGLLFGVVAGSAFFALQYLPATLYTVLIYTYPAMVALGAIFFGERLSPRAWLALGLTLFGVILTVPKVFEGFGGVDPRGIVLVLINALTYAAYILLSSRILRGHTDLMRASAWSISGSLLFAIGVLAFRGVNFPATAAGWGGLLGLASVSTVFPAITFYAGMVRIGAPRAAIVSMAEPVLTLIWAVLLLGEMLETIQIVGAFFIIGSVIMLQIRGEDAALLSRWLRLKLRPDNLHGTSQT